MAAKRASKPKIEEPTLQPERPAEQSRPPVPRLEEIVGQSRAIGVLTNAMTTGRVHHAWIFSGPQGVGKFTTAVAFAAALLDPETGPDLTGRYGPPGDSVTQRLIRAGTHPDLHVITKELARFSDERTVREGKQATIAKDVIETHLLGPIVHAPVMKTASKVGKVFIVDEAELMDRSATNAPVQNALLKTLEEPPGGSVVILVTASEDRLLPTVRSRCQRVAFSALDEADLRAWFERWLKGRAGAFEPVRQVLDAERSWLLGFAGGSPGWIVSAVEQELFTWHEALSPMLGQLEKGKPPVELGATFARLVDERAQAWVKARPDASKEAANVAWSRRLLSLLAEVQRMGMRQEIASGAGEERIGRRLRAIDVLQSAERYVSMNVNTTHVMENVAAQLGVV